MNPLQKIITVYYRARGIEFCVRCGHRKEDHEKHSMLIIYTDSNEEQFVYGKCTKCDCTGFRSSKATKQELELYDKIYNDIGRTV